MDIREKLVELLDEAARICNKTDCCKCRYLIDQSCVDKLLIDHLINNNVTVQEWIPVTERLPKIHTNVLVYRPKMATKIMVSYFCYDRFCDGALDIWGNKVITHWMPLPQPPKGE